MIFKTYDVTYVDNQGNSHTTEAMASDASKAVMTVTELIKQCARVIKVTPKGEW